MTLLSNGNMLDFRGDWYENLVSHSSEKDLLIDYFKKIVSQNKPRNFLEIGMGTHPIFLAHIAPLVFHYMVIEKDIYSGSLPDNVSFIHGDFEKKEILESFDLIVLSHVIYYFKDLDKAVDKVVSHLSKNGSAYFVVNGVDKDYGGVKKAFSDFTKINLEFTYDKLIRILRAKGIFFEESTLEVKIDFEGYEDLYESMRLFFDLTPEEFDEYKCEMIDWLKTNISNRSFIMDQKIIKIVA